MRKSAITVATIVVLSAHGIRAEPPSDNWEAEVRTFDSEFWQKTFNECDLKTLNAMLTDDVEFVHDQVGIARGRRKMVSLTKKGVCSIPGLRLRREQIAGSVHYYPLKDHGKVYGAVISGEHQFFASENGAPEILDSRARFTHVLLRQQGAWKLARVVSYDHEMISSSGGK